MNLAVMLLIFVGLPVLAYAIIVSLVISLGTAAQAKTQAKKELVTDNKYVLAMFELIWGDKTPRKVKLMGFIMSFDVFQQVKDFYKSTEQYFIQIVKGREIFRKYVRDSKTGLTYSVDIDVYREHFYPGLVKAEMERITRIPQA